MTPDPRCPTGWGSHACDLPAGHTDPETGQPSDHACVNDEGPDGEDLQGQPYTGPVNWDTACMIWSQDDPNSFPFTR